MNPSDELVLQAFNRAPSIIQESLSDGRAVDFMESMMTRYSLHVDTVGYVMGFIRNMLLGLLKPDEFITKLNSVGISGATAQKITADLNAEVFIPLRDEMKKGGAATQPSKIPHVPVMSVGAPVQEATIAKPVPQPAKEAEPPAFNLIQPQRAPQTPAPTSTPTPVPAPIAPAPVSQPAPAAIPVPTMRTMQHDMSALQHGAIPEPYPVASVLSTAPHPSQMTPAREFQTASVPYTSTPVASRPVEPVPPISAPVQPLQAPQAPAMPTNPPAAQAPIQPAPATDYSSDPYREPI